MTILSFNNSRRNVTLDKKTEKWWVLQIEEAGKMERYHYSDKKVAIGCFRWACTRAYV